jgi:aspartate dehydrogenase
LRPTIVLKRVGIIGMGFIGAQAYRRISGMRAFGLEIAFVCDRDQARLEGCPPELVLAEPADAALRRPDLIVEAAGPAVVRENGARLLAVADLVPLSVSALADAAVERTLREAARASGHRLLIAHGALVGLEALAERAAGWTAVTVTFRKHPRHVEPPPGPIDAPTVLFDGSVREAARRYPRNVNAMVTCALATVGLDRCRAVLVADPALDVAIAEVRAEAADGTVVETVKRAALVGVSGVEMGDALVHSIVTATGGGPSVQFV